MSVHATGPHPSGPEGAGTTEGPLAHAARVASEEAYLEGLGETQRTAWERASGARPEETSKRLLVALSHTIEKAVMSGPIEEPTVVVALFQGLAFFDREREVYERMAEAGVHVVVAFVAGEEHEPPRGVTTVLLDPRENLADEWTVVAVGPRAGAFLVATDQHRLDADERDHEASRQFLGRWGYARTTATSELARLRFALGDRIDPGARRVIDGLLAETMPAGGQPAASAGTPGETWATTSLHHMIARMHSATAGTRELREQLADAQQAAAARAAAAVDPQSGLTDPEFLQRWSSPPQTAALPIGLGLFDVAELAGRRLRDDHRASYHAARQVAAAMTLPIGPVDAVVRLSEREFLVVVPGASPRHLAALCDDVGEQLELVSQGYPGVALRATLGTMVTRARPLPVEALQNAMARLRDGGGAGPVDTGCTVADERIVVASTALHVEPDDHDERQPGRGTYGPLTAVSTPEDPAEPDGGGAPRAEPLDRLDDPVAPLAPDRGDDRPVAGAGRSPWPGRSGTGQEGDGFDPGAADREGAGVPLPRGDAYSALDELERPGNGPSVFTDLSDPPRQSWPGDGPEMR